MNEKEKKKQQLQQITQAKVNGATTMWRKKQEWKLNEKQ